MSCIGRDLVRAGRSLFVIEAEDAQLTLRRASSWEIQGGRGREEWRIKAVVPGPTTTATITTTWAGVVACSWTGDFLSSPSPLSTAKSTADLAARLEQALAIEQQGPIGSVIPVPPEADRSQLSTDIAGLDGAVLLAETTNANYTGNPSGSPRRDWVPARVGPNPPQTAVQLRQQVEHSLYNLCGLLPALVDPAVDGTGQREAQRRAAIGLTIPLLRMVLAEVKAKLETEIVFRFDPYVLDLQARSVVFERLTRAEVEVERALELSGLADAGVIQMIQALVLDAVTGTTYYRPRPISVQILPATAESEELVGAVEFASAARVILVARDVLSRGSLVKLPDNEVYECVNGAGKPPFFHMWQWSIERRDGAFRVEPFRFAALTDGRGNRLSDEAGSILRGW